MATASINGIELFYDEQGGNQPGIPVVFLHGAGGNHLSWWQQVPVFSRRYRCVAIDHRGFGRSSDPGNLGAAKFVDDLEALLAHLGIERVALVAQSMGGRTALGFALRHPERVAALVMADTWGFFNWPEQTERVRVWQEAHSDPNLPLTQRALGPTFRANEPAKTFLYEQIFALNPPRPASANDDPGAPTAEQVAALRVPTLFLVGLDDVLAPPVSMRAVHELVPGSEYLELPQLGHSAYFEGPTQFNDAVGAFLARHLGGGATVTETTAQPAEAGKPMRKLNVFFDVDNTLIMWDGKLRNHAHDVFRALRDAGHTVYVWSGVGIRRWDMKRHKLDEFVTDYFIKPLEKHHERLDALGVPMVPDYVIDDHSGVVEAFGGYHIPDMAGPDDDHLLRVLAEINELATLGDVEEPGENVAVS